MLRTILLSTLYCLFYISATGQASNRFFVQVDTKKIVQGSYVDVKFILENGDGSDFTPPSFKGFDVLSGPNQSTSMTIVNGRRSNKISLSYTLRPQKIGITQIGSARIMTKAGMRTTEPINIEVVKGSEKRGQDGEDVFIISDISDSIAYV